MTVAPGIWIICAWAVVCVAAAGAIVLHERRQGR